MSKNRVIGFVDQPAQVGEQSPLRMRAGFSTGKPRVVYRWPNSNYEPPAACAHAVGSTVDGGEEWGSAWGGWLLDSDDTQRA